MQRGLRVITLQEAIKESEWLDSTTIISYFDGSNNIFVDCRFNLSIQMPLHMMQQKCMDVFLDKQNLYKLLSFVS